MQITTFLVREQSYMQLDLYSLRLTCKTLSLVATYLQLRNIPLCIDIKSLENLTKILEHHVLYAPKALKLAIC